MGGLEGGEIHVGYRVRVGGLKEGRYFQNVEYILWYVLAHSIPGYS